jgi:two-component system sensor histidine kinase BaeS
MKRPSLRWELFLSILGVSLFTAFVVGLFARTALSTAFENYLAGIQGAGGGPGRMMGRRLLGTAEQLFVSRVDEGVLVAALLAVIVAAGVAVLLAAYLARPILRLEVAAEDLASGDLGQRVTPEGPAEVSALGDAFNVMAGSLEDAENLRRRLVADIAHELRNPLAAARAQAEGMLDGIVATDPARIESLVEDLLHLSALIEDLQELAIADAGRLRYEFDEVDLAALVTREAERGTSLLASGVVMVEPQGIEPLMIRGDERRLAQVMRNLLSNAARHTASGSVSVSVERSGDGALVSVCDTGDGIGPDDLTHIFERFYRADTARAGDTGGAGLGLAISAAIVRDHGGEMFARSDMGTGTTVGFSLPLTP